MWPLPIQHVASSALTLGLVAATGASVRAARPIVGTVFAIASVEIAATVLVLLAVQRGPLVRRRRARVLVSRSRRSCSPGSSCANA